MHQNIMDSFKKLMPWEEISLEINLGISFFISMPTMANCTNKLYLYLQLVYFLVKFIYHSGIDIFSNYKLKCAHDFHIDSYYIFSFELLYA